MTPVTTTFIGGGFSIVDRSFTLCGYTVPSGTKTDFASIPRILTPIFPKLGNNLPAAVLHDYLYSAKARPKPSRKQADKVFLKAMSACGVVWWRRWLMYWAVRLFGWASYKTSTPDGS